MGRIIGIDLGTTNSVAAYWNRRRPKPIMNSDNSSLTPSVVAIEQSIRYVGQKAKERRYNGSKNVVYSVKRFIGRDYDDPESQKALDPERISYSTRKAQNGEVEIGLGDRYFSPVEISAMILEKLKKDAEQELGEDVTHAVVTVPAYFSQRQKNATREAGKLAGLNVLRIINEPTASALAWGFEENISEPQTILVYDFGGGTFDISILLVSSGNYEVLNVDGNKLLGGDDFDNLIIGEMLDLIRQETGEDLGANEAVKDELKGRAEQAKISLSRDEQTRVVEAGIFTSRRGRPVNLDYTLTRKHFENMIEDRVRESISITNRALKQANLEIKDIDHVLLVGGTTRIPFVRQQLKEIFGDKIEIDVDPMQCVALGAAIQTTIPIEWVCSNCKTVNEGTEDVCHSCQHPRTEEGEIIPVIVCDACGKSNRQGRLDCWSCGAKIGAAMGFDGGENKLEGNEHIRIGDITSSYICIEIERDRTDMGHVLSTIIPKGTPYPTHEPFYGDYYTNRSGQERIETPVFEVEQENVEKDKWEHIGVVINEKIPTGTPEGTPVMVEMRIDGDGILTVNTYLKRMKDDTLVSGTFKFGSKESSSNTNESKVLDELGILGFILGICADDPRLKKHLNPGQAEQAKQIADEAKEIVEAKDERRAKPALERAEKLRNELPVPTLDLFYAFWSMQQPQISAVEKSEVNQTIIQMEKKADQEDFDEANQQLKRLRELNQAMDQKIPSNLLKAGRK